MVENAAGKKDCRCICGDPSINQDLRDFHDISLQALADTAITQQTLDSYDGDYGVTNSTPCELRGDGTLCDKYTTLNKHVVDWTKHVHLEYLHQKNHYFDYLDFLDETNATAVAECLTKHDTCRNTCDNKQFDCISDGSDNGFDCARKLKNCKDSCVTCTLYAQGKSRVQCLPTPGKNTDPTSPYFDNNPNCGGSNVAELCKDGHQGDVPVSGGCTAADEAHHPTAAPTAHPTSTAEAGRFLTHDNPYNQTSYPTKLPTQFPTATPTDSPTYERPYDAYNEQN
jgi:hypothetical protein